VIDPGRTGDWRTALTELWEQRWPTSRPIAHELPYTQADRWVRFHSLPGSKRYADNEREYAEIIRRHGIVLDELTDGSGEPLLAVTCSWSDRPRPRRLSIWSSAVRRRAKYWQSILEDDSDPTFLIWTHLGITRMSTGGRRLNRLLRRVADDKTAGVIVADPDLRWLYHPYDGGADVIAATSSQRDALRDRHATWLSPHPHGL
jgi:hypothetical protein